MPSFPRAIFPTGSTHMIMPAALMEFSQSGKVQIRSTVQTGRRWTETLQGFKAHSPEGRALIAFINGCLRNGTVFDIDPYGYQVKNGLGTGSPVIAGANQTGNLLNTQAWTGTDPMLKAGDIIRIAGISQVFDVLTDAPNNISGAVQLTINPPIFAGVSPLNNAAITHNNVRLNAVLADPPALPAYGPNEFIVGLSLTFAEVV